MNENEQKTFYIANCKCCMLADAMKTCPMCRFNIGLAAKVVKLTDRIPSPPPTYIETFVVAEGC